MSRDLAIASPAAIVVQAGQKMEEKSEQKLESIVFDGKGSYVDHGTTAIVELLPSGEILKRAYRGHGGAEEAESARELQTEAQIYQTLGDHPRLVRFMGYDPEEREIRMEYMPNGKLEIYLADHVYIVEEQKLKWVDQAIECLELLHSKKVIHADFGPHNLLLDHNLDLHVADFGGSSLDGAKTNTGAPEGYWLPGPEEGIFPTATETSDLFSLGSTLYFIFTGYGPFHDLDPDEINERFRKGQFPNVSTLPCGDIMVACWHKSAQSIQNVRHDFQGYLAKWVTTADIER